jgi:hypothetical protein
LSRGRYTENGKSPGADDQSAPGFFRKEKRGKKMKRDRKLDVEGVSSLFLCIE